MVSIVTLLHIIVLAVVQGITEFLPISSSAHLILVPIALGWPDQGLLLDVAVHVGTLLAVMLYFWRDVHAMALGCLHLFTGRRGDHVTLVILIVVATIPIVIAGFLLKDYLASARDIRVIGWTTLVFGLCLYGADRFGSTERGIGHLRKRDALMIGLAQMLALVPGVSRSGVTMTAGRALGIARPDAARFALLMSIPTRIAAGSLEGYDLYKQSDTVLTEAALMGVGLSFVTALVAIALLMAWLRRATYTPFVVYRVILGVVLLAFGYGLV
jgi:undecaprenyl-diphosphatase